MIQLQGVLSAASEFQRFCDVRRWPFCFIGGIAVQRWGEPRLTQDVDLTLLTGFGQEISYIEAVLRSFVGRVPDAREFALQHRVLLVRTSRGIPIDIALGAFPFEERSIQRATKWNWNATDTILTCSAEDLLIHKCFAGRDRDWSDIERILVRQHGKLNLRLVREELPPLLDLKGKPEALSKFNQITDTVDLRLRTDR